MRNIVFILGTPIRVFLALLAWVVSAAIGEPLTIHWRALLTEGVDRGIR
jgi:hypothetical protein